jgi:flagellar hook-associated protein 2
LQKQLDNNGDQQDKVNGPLRWNPSACTVQRADVKMASLNALDSYVSQMVTTWNKSSD